uniref:Uncharacterized protein n=1 Tax=Knipowitschia caucasica TaxID=637954 RepID=A0AAV2MHG3_KNICA
MREGLPGGIGERGRGGGGMRGVEEVRGGGAWRRITCESGVTSGRVLGAGRRSVVLLGWWVGAVRIWGLRCGAFRRYVSRCGRTPVWWGVCGAGFLAVRCPVPGPRAGGRSGGVGGVTGSCRGVVGVGLGWRKGEKGVGGRPDPVTGGWGCQERAESVVG